MRISDLKKTWSPLITGLNKESSFVLTHLRIFLLSVVLAAQLLLIIFFLNPSGTEEYVASYRNLRLAGYSLCIILPFFFIYGVEGWIKQFFIKKWKVYHNLISKILLITLIIAASYLYNALVVNEFTPSFSDFGSFFIWIGLPYLAILLPVVIFVYLFFFKKNPDQLKSDHQLTIHGKNKEDIIHLEEKNFVFAKASQNYVKVHYLKNEEIKKQLIRTTLTDLYKQLPNALRIHRSYLVNPDYISAIEGNSRKRYALLINNANKIPVSPSYQL